MEQQCVNPHEIQEGDLLKYLDGNASPAVIEHVTHCAACATEAALLQKSRTALQTIFFRESCPSTDELMQYQMKELSRKQMQAIKNHLVDCKSCREELSELVNVLNEPLESSWLEQWVSVGRQILTAGLVQSKMRSIPALRGTPQRELTYKVANHKISLTILPPPVNEGLWQVEGRFKSDGALVEMLIQLQQENQVVATDTLDEFGYFELRQLKGGIYTLIVESATTSIIIPDLKLI
jgi:uncharacterized protein YlaN (UPF0358 family)